MKLLFLFKERNAFFRYMADGSERQFAPNGQFPVQVQVKYLDLAQEKTRWDRRVTCDISGYCFCTWEDKIIRTSHHCLMNTFMQEKNEHELGVA